MEPFYYQHLEKSEQTIYHAIKTGVTALEDHFLVPYADPARISMIFFLVRLDCPEIFYAVTVKRVSGRSPTILKFCQSIYLTKRQFASSKRR